MDSKQQVSRTTFTNHAHICILKFLKEFKYPSNNGSEFLPSKAYNEEVLPSKAFNEEV
jgi:hypothetical protein